MAIWSGQMKQLVEKLASEMSTNDELGSNLKALSDLIKQKTDFGQYNENDQNAQKWIKLAKEYAIKFRADDLDYYSNQANDQQELVNINKIRVLIIGLRTHLNTFLLQNELLIMEDELEAYTARAKCKLFDKGEKGFEQIQKAEMQELADVIARVQMQIAEIREEIRANAEELTGKMAAKIANMRTECAELWPNVYLTEHPLEKAQIRLNGIRNNREQIVKMCDLQKVMELLIIESKMEILRYESGISLGSQIDQNEVDWRAFLALAKAFKFDWKEIQQRRAKLWAKDQWDVRRQMEQIKQAAQMRPIKAELKEKFASLLIEMWADLGHLNEYLVSPMDGEQPLNDQEVATLRRFHERAIKLCEKFDKFLGRIDLSTNEIVAKLNLEMAHFEEHQSSNDWWTMLERHISDFGGKRGTDLWKSKKWPN